MNKSDNGIASIIHQAHENMARYYGHLNQEGQVSPQSLEDWNYQRNVLWPITRIVEQWGHHPPFSMLDAGCGNGQLFRLYQSLGAEPIYGLDFSRNMLTEARDRAARQGVFFIPCRSALEAVAVKSCSFDLINLYGILEHLPQPGQVLSELLRVLKPGGLLIMSVPRKWSLAWATYALFCTSLQDIARGSSRRSRFMLWSKFRYYRFFTSRDIAQLLGTCSGFKTVARVPIAHGGVLGPPAGPLKKLAARGSYGAIDAWNGLCRRVGLPPAGEFLGVEKLADDGPDCGCQA